MIHDAVTGVYSIEYFEHQLAAEVAYSLRHGIPLALILFTVDYISDLSDAFGADARDQMLSRVADVVKEHIRTEDVLARYGVADFAVLCRGATIKETGFLAKRIRQAVESAFLTHRGLELPITVSLGVASLAADRPGPSEVVQSAERALEEARRVGNCLVLGDGELGMSDPEFQTITRDEPRS